MQSPNKPNKAVRISTRKVAFYGVFITLALVAGYLETLIPLNFSVPGIKLGLANLIVIIVMQSMGAADAFVISMIRIVLSGFLFGNLAAILYSMAGAILSLIVMAVMKRTGWFSLTFVSVGGGIAHNIGQIIVAVLVLENTRLFYYLPVLVIAGLVTGILVGVAAGGVAKRLPAAVMSME